VLRATPPSGGRCRERLIKVDGLVIRVGTGRVLVLRPALVADVAPDQAADVAVLIPDWDQYALAVEVGDAAVLTAVRKPGIQ